MPPLNFQGIKLERDTSGCLKYPIEPMPLPKRLWVPMPGCSAPEVLLVQRNSRVQLGSVLCRPASLQQAVSPADAIVEDLIVLDHPILGHVPCAVLRCEKECGAQKPEPREGGCTAEEIVKAAKEAGIVDELDGRPLHQKLKRMQLNGVSLLVACAVDDDPYTVSDVAFLRENTAQVCEGLELAALACKAGNKRLAVWDRSEAKRIHGLVGQKLELLTASGRYPARAALKRKLRRSGEKASFIGVQACSALYEAVQFGKPQTSFLLTVAGDGVERPRNLLVACGTLLADILRYCNAKPGLVCYGSVMTGKEVSDLSIPVTASVRCVVVLKNEPAYPVSACIGCGRCAEVCPRGILPWYIHEQMEKALGEPRDIARAKGCIGCFACTAVCPAGIHLAEEIKRAASVRREGELL